MEVFINYIEIYLYQCNYIHDPPSPFQNYIHHLMTCALFIIGQSLSQLSICMYILQLTRPPGQNDVHHLNISCVAGSKLLQCQICHLVQDEN